MVTGVRLKVGLIDKDYRFQFAYAFRTQMNSLQCVNTSTSKS